MIIKREAVAKNCSLYRDKIPSAIEEFARVKGLECNWTSKRDDQDTFKLSKGKTNSFVTIYYKKNGLTSISNSNKAVEFAEECCEYVAKSASLPDTFHQTFTVKKAKMAEYEYFKMVLEEEELVVLNTNDANVHERIRVNDKTGASITVTLYKNATLLIQGAVTPLFVSVMNAALQWMVVCESTTSVISLKNVSCDIECDVSKHIEHIDRIRPDGDVIIKMIETSLQLAQSGIKVTDYGCYTYGVLKAIEGLLKLRLLEDVPPFDNFGDYFVCDDRTKTYKFQSTLYDSHAELKRALEKAYTHFRKYRHSTFHVDNQIETSKLLTYSEAIAVLYDSLAIINNLCSHWD